MPAPPFTSSFLETCDLLSSFDNIVLRSIPSEGSKHTQSECFAIPAHPFRPINFTEHPRSRTMSKNGSLNRANGQKVVDRPLQPILHEPYVICVRYERLCDVFFKVLDPLYNPKHSEDNRKVFCDQLAKHVELLKSITSKHKQLYKVIFDSVYTDFSNVYDETYKNEQFMIFWCELLRTSIYLIHEDKLAYTMYEPKTFSCDTLLCIKIQRTDAHYTFELLDIQNMTDFNSYCILHNVFRFYDDKTLKSMKVDEVREICQKMKIPFNLKKQEMIDQIIHKYRVTEL
jgi:hypothetical protein